MLNVGTRDAIAIRVEDALRRRRWNLPLLASKAELPELQLEREMAGEQDFPVFDVYVIARALDLPISDLLPPDVGAQSNGSDDSAWVQR